MPGWMPACLSACLPFCLSVALSLCLPLSLYVPLYNKLKHVALSLLSIPLPLCHHQNKPDRKAGRPRSLEAFPLRREARDDPQGGPGGVVTDGGPQRLHPYP